MIIKQCRLPQCLEGEPVLDVLVVVAVEGPLVLDLVLVPEENGALVARRRQQHAVVAPANHVHRLDVPLQVSYELDAHATPNVLAFATRFFQMPNLST